MKSVSVDIIQFLTGPSALFRIVRVSTDGASDAVNLLLVRELHHGKVFVQIHIQIGLVQCLCVGQSALPVLAPTDDSYSRTQRTLSSVVGLHIFFFPVCQSHQRFKTVEFLSSNIISSYIQLTKWHLLDLLSFAQIVAICYPQPKAQNVTRYNANAAVHGTKVSIVAWSSQSFNFSAFFANDRY